MAALPKASDMVGPARLPTLSYQEDVKEATAAAAGEVVVALVPRAPIPAGSVSCQSSSSDFPYSGVPSGNGSDSSSTSISRTGTIPGASASKEWWNKTAKGSGFLDSKYDAEIWSVAIPALAAMLLDPMMGVMNSGVFGVC
eukprot:scaffold97425_cov25-Tisochrysis_lutea.AAC.1